MRHIFGRAAAVLPVIMLGGLIALAGPARPAAADTVATVTVNLSPPQVSCAGGQCEYLMNCSVKVTNLTNQDLSLPASSPVTVLNGSVAWSSPSGSGTVSSGVGVQWPGAVNGYAAIAPGSSITAANCQLFPIIPQAATSATLTVTVQVYPGDYPNLGPVQAITGTDTFLQGGAALPPGFAIVGPVAAAGLGALLLMLQRRRGRR